jgi:hypothetical protein
VASFGPAGLGFRPLAGDWNGDSFGTIGVYDPAGGVFFLKNAALPGPADYTYVFGGANLVPLAGNWDGA